MIPGTRFSCTMCGDCCTGSQVVRLTAGDLKMLVRRLGLASVSHLRTQGVVSLVREPAGHGRFAWRPRLRFRTRPLRQCPFLVNDISEEGAYRGLCSLHPHDKPLVCRLSPLTRDVTDTGDSVEEVWSFTAPTESCPGVGKGEILAVRAPEELKPELSEEVEWMRFLIRESPSCPDEASAWSMVERWEG